MINAHVPCLKQLRAGNYHSTLIFSFTVQRCTHATRRHANAAVHKVANIAKNLLSSLVTMSRATLKSFFLPAHRVFMWEPCWSYHLALETN